MLRIIHKCFFHQATFTYIFFNEMRKEVHSISTTRPTHTYLLLSPKLDFVGKILLIKGGMYYYLAVKLIQSLIDATILLIQCWIVSRYSKSVFKWSSSLDRSPPWYLYLLCSKKKEFCIFCHYGLPGFTSKMSYPWEAWQQTWLISRHIHRLLWLLICSNFKNVQCMVK